MRVSLSGKHSSSYKKTGMFIHRIYSVWKKASAALKANHQKRMNKHAYTLLLQNDDYLLRDIGVSRESLLEMRSSENAANIDRTFEKSRATNGRFVSPDL